MKYDLVFKVPYRLDAPETVFFVDIEVKDAKKDLKLSFLLALKWALGYELSRHSGHWQAVVPCA